MPTVILFDVSLSMSRRVATASDGSSDELTRRQLGIVGVNTFLDYLTLNCKMEFVSLVIFSSLYEQLVSFTKDYTEIRLALTRLDEFNKTCIESALAGVGSLVVDEWGLSPQCQVLMVTDGNPGIGSGSLRHTVQHYTDRGCDTYLHPEDKSHFPFRFASKLHIACITDPSADATFRASEQVYKQLINISGQGGELLVPDGSVSPSSVQQMFTRLGEKYYSPFIGSLLCGNLSCAVQVLPPLENYDKVEEFEHVRRTPSKSIEICGFIDLKDISSPPYISRHLLLPIAATPVGSVAASSFIKQDSLTDGTEDKDDKSAAFTVLLHGSLKVEGMIALAQIGDDWFGMIYSFADNKKKSNLFLSVFQPGTDVLPWLGNLRQLGPMSELNPPVVDAAEASALFPVMPKDKRSYTQNCVVWIKIAGLQADIQKILRNARKLPEKHLHFYKELNRLRKAALSFGFYELLSVISQLLERECTQLPNDAHPDAALQMTHAAKVLRSQYAHDVAYTIQPLRTNFSVD